MFALRTRDDWTTARITIDDGGGAQFLDLAATDNSARDAMESIVSWATATFVPEFSWSWAANTDGGALLEISANNAFSMVANAGAQSILGWAGSYSSDTAHGAINSCAGTLDPAVSVAYRQALPQLEESNIASANGTLRVGVAGLGLHAANVDTVLTALETGRLQSVTASAATPREAWIYQRHIDAGTWRLAALGAIELRWNKAANRWGMSAEIAGGLE